MFCFCMCYCVGEEGLGWGVGVKRQSVYLWVSCFVLFWDVKICNVSWHFRNCTCFYIWLKSVWEVTVAQLYHVGVYFFFFFFKLIIVPFVCILGVCLWLASEASLQSIRNVCTGRSVIHALYSLFNFNLFFCFFFFKCMVATFGEHA